MYNLYLISPASDSVSVHQKTTWLFELKVRTGMYLTLALAYLYVQMCNSCTDLYRLVPPAVRTGTYRYVAFCPILSRGTGFQMPWPQRRTQTCHPDMMPGPWWLKKPLTLPGILCQAVRTPSQPGSTAISLKFSSWYMTQISFTLTWMISWFQVNCTWPFEFKSRLSTSSWFFNSLSAGVLPYRLASSVQVIKFKLFFLIFQFKLPVYDFNLKPDCHTL